MFKKILIATDGSNHADRALTVAADLAGKYGAELIILHVQMHGKVPHGFRRMAQVEHIGDIKEPKPENLYNIPGNMMTMLGEIEPDAAEDEYFDFLAKHIVQNSARAAKEAGVGKCESRIESGDVADTILEASAEEGVDLVVLGTRGIGAIKRMLLGSVATKVIQLSDCPCLTVR